MSVEEFMLISAELHNPLLIDPEVSVEDADMIPPCSIIRFGSESGDFHFTTAYFESTSQVPSYWKDWVDAIVGVPEY